MVGCCILDSIVSSIMLPRLKSKVQRLMRNEALPTRNQSIMTEVIAKTSRIDEKAKPKFFHQFKLIRRYFSNPTLRLREYHHKRSTEKPPKYILCHQGHMEYHDNNTFHLQNITSPKMSTSQRKTNHWTIKQFKKRIRTSHMIKRNRQKSATLSVEPTCRNTFEGLQRIEPKYHTLKEITTTTTTTTTTPDIFSNFKHSLSNLDPGIITYATIDEVSLQSISVDSLSFDESENETHNQKLHKQITNLDEVIIENKLNYKPIIESDFVDKILKESGLNANWTIDSKSCLQQHQKQYHQPLKHCTSSNVQLSVSDIYSIFASHDQLDVGEKSLIKKTNGEFNRRTTDSFQHQCSTYANPSEVSNNFEKLILFQQAYRRCRNLFRIIITPSPTFEKNSSVNEHKSLSSNLNKLKAGLETIFTHL
ncbi:unnamed protein product [Heterobilharzia americana]|nr:unnamed protein product [Heterobilharzia americana]